MAEDQVQEDEAQEGETSEEQSTEATEKATPERAYELAKGLQKGYTLTRQELAEVRSNLDAVKAAIEESKNKDEFDEFGEGEKPLTKAELLNVLSEWDQKKETAQQQKQAQVDRIIEDLKVEGMVKDDKEADLLIEFVLDSAKRAGLKSVTPDYILSVYPAWEKTKDIKKLEQEVKTKVKREAGSKVGTSERTNPTEQGVSYKEIRQKDWDEF